MRPIERVLEALDNPRPANGGWMAKCPGHEDSKPSLSIDEGENGRVLIKCFAGCTAEAVVAAMGLTMRDLMPEGSDRHAFRQSAGKVADSRPTDRRGSTAPTFESEDAARTWAVARSRARDDEAVEQDRPVYQYLAKRKLMPAWELAAFGILAEQPGLHPTIWHWPARRYQVIAPLYDAAGIVTNIQARGLPPCNPKTLVPAGSRLVGAAFADSRGRDLLAGEAESEFVVFGEGLTDMLALAIASPFPVITSPGTSNAVAACGPWANGRRILLALDNDVAGDRALLPVSAELYRHGATSVLRIRWPSGAKDACDVLAVRGENGLREFLERSLRVRVA